MSVTERVVRGLRPRNPNEPHRAATPLELFFDLCFVVAVAQAAGSLHHQLIDGQGRHALVAYPMVFFAIWWAWVNFTWFASAYDNDDVLYRLTTLVQIGGALVLAAGVPRGFERDDFAVMVVGYVIMRIALVSQWLRAGASHPEGRACARRYAVGISVCELGWILLLVTHGGWRLLGFAVLVVSELAVPMWAERAGTTSWHPGHIVERYGLFTLIVLGETVAAATLALQAALDAGGSIADLWVLGGGGLLVVSAMWWIYFDQPADVVVAQARSSFETSAGGAFVWGYGHLLVFASAAAVGAGLSVAVDDVGGHTDLTHTQVGLTVTVPVAAYLLSVWALHVRSKPPGAFRFVAAPVAAGLILAATLLPDPVLPTGLLLAGLVAAATLSSRRAEQNDGSAGRQGD